MSLHAASYFLAAILGFCLGIFIISKKIKSKDNLPFFILVTSTLVWQAGSGLALMTKSPVTALYYTRIAFLGIIFIPVTTYHLALNVLRIRRTKTLLIGYIIALSWVPLSRTPLILDGVYRYPWGLFFRAGALHPIFMLFFIYFMLLVFVLLYSSYKKETDPLKKNRKKYFFVALFLAYLGSIDYIPTYGVDICPCSSLAVIACIIVFAYAVVAYRLMDIKVVIKKTLVFAGLFSIVFAITTMVISGLSAFIIPLSRENIYVYSAVGIVIFILLHDNIKRFLVNATDRYLFQKEYDPGSILREFSDYVLTILNLDRICRVTVDTLAEHLHLKNCAVLLLNRSECGYDVYDFFGMENKRLRLDIDSRLVTTLAGRKIPQLLHSYDKSLQASEEVKKEMQAMESELCIPLVIHDELVGILSLGPKKSDQLYSADDVDILMTLARGLSISISNARLFSRAAQNEKLATLGTITSAINHEIGGPLGRIRLRIEMYQDEQEKASGDKRLKENLKKAEGIMSDTLKEIRRVLGITSKLSGFAKPSGIVESKPVEVKESIGYVLDLLKHKLELDEIKVEQDIPAGLPKMIVDEDQAHQIFFNLIKNAAEAIKENGTIMITAREGLDRIKIEIRDTGRGIPEEKLGKIFQPFYTTKSAVKGSGYGLVIVKELIQRNKGTLEVESRINKGSTFYMEFQKA